MSQPEWLKTFEGTGFHTEAEVLRADEIVALQEELAARRECPGVRQKEDAIYAIRNLLEVEAVRELVRHPAVARLVTGVLGPNAFAVRGILFDKNSSANWKVVWHQDTTIAVREMRELPGWGPWSIKEGVVHVQPPAEILQKMLTVRIHLDTCGLDNGPLRILPGSHRNGRLSHLAVQQARADIAEVACEVPAGGALLVRPLLLHASSPAAVPARRRVIHLEFANEELPNGLEWEQEVHVAAPVGVY